jgi:hypothetical protein
MLNSIAFIISGEIMVDAVLGYSYLFLSITNIFLLYVTPIIMEAWQAYGLFYFLDGLILIALICIILFFKETQGLTDKEKKEMYCPKELRK